MAASNAQVNLPRTLQRSSAKAQHLYAEVLDSALGTYGPGARAYRTAIAALKQRFEKVGDRWVAKRRKGPSDPQAAQSGRAAREHPKETFGGVDFYGHTFAQLYERARHLGVPGRSTMRKAELARAIAGHQAGKQGRVRAGKPPRR